jgi:hypothetical protein
MPKYYDKELPQFIEVEGIEFVWNEVRSYYEPYIGSRYEREEYEREERLSYY